MNSVERVKSICADRKIAISKLERDLGFSNGYIGQLRKGIFPADRLDKIANYLSVSTDYLLYGDTQKETPTDSVSINDDDIKFALSGGEGVITDEQYEEVKKFVQFIKERDGNDKK